ncbi:hypothetical protein HPB49_019984 [Dermacentor silvarum]|uniref:Uncharacterized protein n=1 Tax=Dermacentor silvarum TaxID=543639 RepID=A0ACB8CZJ2_DERSI|nr:hypothetical protein HPB49_019984 [Dermacentor silvarum]
MPTNAELAKEIEVLRSEVAEMRQSLMTFNDLYESVKSRNVSLVQENKSLRDENKSLVDSNKNLTQRVGDLEQYSRQNNVEIKGSLKTDRENCLSIVQVLGEKIGCPVAAADIVIVHRVPAKQGTNIIARFCSRTKKADFASKARKLTCDVTQSVVRIDCVAGQCTLTNPADRSAPAKTFCFDGAYDHNSTTEQIYDDIVYPIVEASGPQRERGLQRHRVRVRPNGLRQVVLDARHAAGASAEGHHPSLLRTRVRGHRGADSSKYLVHASYLEIYNETCGTCWPRHAQKLDLKEHPDKGVYVPGKRSATSHPQIS